jgi:protocatechuate 3,4-dioxygenase beta subunit
VVEIWQVDNTGTYLKERESEKYRLRPRISRDSAASDRINSEYYFRTIKPAVYPGRSAPHVHFMVRIKGRESWTTQLYIKGHPGNQRDGIYAAIGDAQAQEAVTVEFAPMRESRIGELAARFDIVPGFTPRG